MVKVIVKEATTIVPFQQTPNTSLWISNLDLLVPMSHVSTVYFYNRPDGNNSFSSLDTRVLKEALSKVLVPYYPVAGRLGRDENNRVEIKCNSKGVLFIEAETTSVIDDFGDFSSTTEMQQLAPKVDSSADSSSYPLLVLQVTTFACGGVCIGVALHHTLSDAVASLQLINSWMNLARGAPIGIPPFLDRGPLKARVPPTPTFNHVEYGPPPPVNTPTQSSDGLQKSQIKAIAKVFEITVEQLNALKTKSMKQLGHTNPTKYSTYEALASHLWRCICKARGLPDDQATRLSIPTDGRFRFRPPLPAGYFGNVVFTTTVTSLSSDIQSEPLAHTAKRIREAIKRMDDQYLRSVLDHLELQDDLRALARGPHTFKCPNLNIVSWMKMPVADADFGWGRPIYMGSAGVGYEGLVYIVPNPAKDGGNYLTVFLEPNHMLLFEKLFYDI